MEPVVVDVPGSVDFTALLLIAAREHRRQAAKHEAIELSLLADYAAQHPTDEYLHLEIAAELQVSPRYAQTRLALATTLTERLPATMAAMRGGRVDRYRAEKIVDATANLTVEEAGQ